MPIVIEKLTHTYMPGSMLQTKAIQDISLTIEEGEFLGIIGHTGSGKSTLMQHLNGLLLPTSGKVLVDSLNISDKKQRLEARKLVGMVFQYPEYQLFEETVYKDVAFGPKNLKLSDSEIEERVLSALEIVGLHVDEVKNKSPFELSGGEKRRVALAGIIAMHPKYLALDEPMAGLDPRGRKEILAVIEKLHKASGCTVVMVSHSMDDIARLADRIAVLNQSELAMVGTPREVFMHAGELVDLGLDVPQATRLVLKLAEMGVDIPKNIYQMDVLGTFLKGRLKHV